MLAKSLVPGLLIKPFQPPQDALGQQKNDLLLKDNCYLPYIVILILYCSCSTYIHYFVTYTDIALYL
jgi:hypothetical protein